MGAVTGDHSFLKIVTNATTRPPIAPTMIQGPATDGSSAVRTCAHTHAAGRTTKNNRKAVRFTVPSTAHRRAVHPALLSGTACRCENQRTDVQVEMGEHDWGDPPGLQVVQREHQKCGSVAQRRRDALIEVIECLDGDTHQHGQRTALGEPQNFGHGVCAYEEFFRERVDDHPGHGADGYPEAREGVDYLLRICPSSAARGVPPPDGQVTDRE